MSNRRRLAPVGPTVAGTVVAFYARVVAEARLRVAARHLSGRLARAGRVDLAAACDQAEARRRGG